MDAIKYLKEKWRMIESLESGNAKGCTSSKCAICPLSMDNNETSKLCPEFERTEPEKVIALVEKWSKEHPQKTMLQDFLEKHPDAPLYDDDGIPRRVCPHHLGYEKSNNSTCRDISRSCVECWNRPLVEGV